MRLEFNNLNPCLLLDNIIKNGISVEDVIVTSNIKENETIAETVWVECKDTDSEKINELASNLDNTTIVQANEQQILNAQLLQQNANMQLEIEQQKQLNAQILLQIAQLGGNANV